MPSLTGALPREALKEERARNAQIGLATASSFAAEACSVFASYCTIQSHPDSSLPSLP